VFALEEGGYKNVKEEVRRQRSPTNPHEIADPSISYPREANDAELGESNFKTCMELPTCISCTHNGVIMVYVTDHLSVVEFIHQLASSFVQPP
jgi:hypothetical protein